MTWKALAKVPGTRPGSRMVEAYLVTGLAMDSMSTAWKSSLCSTLVGAWPVMQRIGMESAEAE